MILLSLREGKHIINPIDNMTRTVVVDYTSGKAGGKMKKYKPEENKIPHMNRVFAYYKIIRICIDNLIIN